MGARRVSNQDISHGIEQLAHATFRKGCPERWAKRPQALLTFFSQQGIQLRSSPGDWLSNDFDFARSQNFCGSNQATEDLHDAPTPRKSADLGGTSQAEYKHIGARLIFMTPS